MKQLIDIHEIFGGGMKGVRHDPERREIRFLSRLIPLKNARILEIGCGSGRLTRKIAGVATSIVGIDTTGPSVDRAFQQIPARYDQSVQYLTGSAIDLSFRDQIFDVVLLSWAL